MYLDFVEIQYSMLLNMLRNDLHKLCYDVTVDEQHIFLSLSLS